jgi:hypothetical protein
MLSICIPIFNYNCTFLVKELYYQAKACGIPFEILLIDDCSENFYRVKNLILFDYYDRYIDLERNIGRSKIRNRLAEEAKYPYLLFLDCDSMPVSDNYIADYLPYCKPDTVCYGGRVYESECPYDDVILRWKYGVKRESYSAKVRRRKPNHRFWSNNFLIHKPLFQSIKFDERLKRYGHEDTLLGLELQEKGIVIQHIDNPLTHFGLEYPHVFLENTEYGIANLIKMEKIFEQKYAGKKVKSGLLQTLRILRKLYLLPLYIRLFKVIRPLIKMNLVGKWPSMFLFDLYKLGIAATICSNSGQKND